MSKVEQRMEQLPNDRALKASGAANGGDGSEGMDARGRAMHGAIADEGMDARGRAIHGAIAEELRTPRGCGATRGCSPAARSFVYLGYIAWMIPPRGGRLTRHEPRARRHAARKLAAISVAMFAFGFALCAVLRQVLRDYRPRRPNRAGRVDGSRAHRIRAHRPRRVLGFGAARRAVYARARSQPHGSASGRGVRGRTSALVNHDRLTRVTAQAVPSVAPGAAAQLFQQGSSASASRAKSSSRTRSLTLKLAFMVDRRICHGTRRRRYLSRTRTSRLRIKGP